MDTELESVKKKIKEWEHAFTKEYGHAPSKSDIDKCSSNIRLDYINYSKLKSNANTNNIIAKINKPDESSKTNKIPEWKKVTSNKLTLRHNKLNNPDEDDTHKPVTPSNYLSASSTGRINTDNTPESTAATTDTVSMCNTADTPVHTYPITALPVTTDTMQSTATTKLPIHYSLFKNRSNSINKISDEWLERHLSEENDINQLTESLNIKSIDDTDSTRVIEVSGKNSVFSGLYGADTTNTTTQIYTSKECPSKLIAQDSYEFHNYCSSSEEDENDDDIDNNSSDNSSLPVDPSSNTPPIYDTTEVENNNKVDSIDNTTVPSNNSKRKMESKMIDRADALVVEQPAKKTKLSSIRSTALSNNFVKLNLLQKRYKAKGRGISGTMYKRKAFKRGYYDGNPRAGVGKGGSQTCFRCGAPGHWAKNCSSKVSEKDLGHFGGESCVFTGEHGSSHDVDAEIEIFESPLPTINEAALMARGMKLHEIREKDMKSDEIPFDGESYLEISKPRANCLSAEPLVMDITPIEEIQAMLDTGLNELGYEYFRPGQKEAVTRILRGQSTLLLLGTGGGKSLCYQLPVYLYNQRQPSVILVVSPLVSLMEDQCLQMPSAIKATCLHTNQTLKQRETIMSSIKSGEYSVILLSPEAVVGKESLFLSLLSHLPPVPFVCIDEAHCMSQWSHNFRPSYLRVCHVLKRYYGVRCILALTATATHDTIQDLTKQLEIQEMGGVIKGPLLPDNLELSVSITDSRDASLVELLQSDIFRELSSIIIYCTRQKETERIAQLIRTCLMDLDNLGGSGESRSSLSSVAECYHAGLSAAKRKRVQINFMLGSLRIVVATIAFGMGLNKSDVRAILHYNMPNSFENYVQEVGRAGRDGVTSFCHVFLISEGSDIWEIKKHIYSNFVERNILKEFVNASFPNCSCPVIDTKDCTNTNNTVPGICCGHMVAIDIDKSVIDFDMNEENIATILCYFEELGWIEVSQKINDCCKIVCYGGEKQLRKLSEKVPIIAAAQALAHQNNPDNLNFKKGMISLSMSEISRQMNWEISGIRKELKSLSYNDRGTSYKYSYSDNSQSTIMIEFSQLSFCFRMFHKSEICNDDVIDYLERRLNQSEVLSLNKLALFHEILTTAATKQGCKEYSLSQRLGDYFNSNTELKIDHVTNNSLQEVDNNLVPQLRQDIISFLSTHSELAVTGRAIARIFHGISSPKFPAILWGSNPYWRRYINMDFHLIRKLAISTLGKYEF